MNTAPYPSLVALRVFAASARSRSFARAAAELGISPGAVTQHIRTVEKWTGNPLFRRTGRSVVPTEAAEAALPLLLDAFEMLTDGADLLRSAATNANIVTVQAPPAFSSKWLLPRLAAFHDANPGVEVWISVQSQSQVLTAETRAPDIVIQYGLNLHEGYVGEPLLRDSVVVVASPEFVARHGPFRTPADIVGAPLLHYSGKKIDKSFPDWSRWLNAQGVQGVVATEGPRFDHPALVVEQAVAGQGIALAKWIVAVTDIQAGRLVAPFADRTPVSSSYWLQHPRGRTLSAAARRLEVWLRKEIASQHPVQISPPPLARRSHGAR